MYALCNHCLQTTWDAKTNDKILNILSNKSNIIKTRADAGDKN